MTHPELTRKLSLFFALALALPGLAQAQQDFDDGADDVEEIIVTGSYIKGTPEDAPNPVTAISREELLDQGSPTIVEIVKNLGISSGVDGETNQFQSNGQEGAANINLRGLGPGRTLVLMNGKRITNSGISVGQLGYQQYVNINNIPVLAVERIEMLRDGASAIYGSDAVSGVANFLTRDTFEGLEIAFNHRMVSDSDGWNEAGIVWGQNFGDSSHLLLAFGYNTRSELEIRHRDYALRGPLENPQSGWSGLGNPGRFSHPLLPSVSFVHDPACPDFSGLEVDPLEEGILCRFQYTQYDNLVEDESRYQLYAEWDMTFAGGSTLEITGLIANIEVPEWKTSPSYPPATTLTDNRVPSNHAGFVQMVKDVNAGEYNTADYKRMCSNYDSSAPTSTLWVVPTAAGACDYSEITTGFVVQEDANGIERVHKVNAGVISTDPLNAIFLGRYSGWGAEGPQTGSRTYDTLNLTYDYSFTMGANDGIDVVIQGGYGSQSTEIIGADMLTERLRLGLLGYGGDGCITNLAEATAALAGNAVSGKTPGTAPCLYYNPFSNALLHATRGNAPFATQRNPNYEANLANGPEVLNWMYESTPATFDTTLLTTEAVFSGTFGDHGWAAGAQLRLETYDGDYRGFNNFDNYPCRNEFINNIDTCPTNHDIGVYAFLSAYTPFSLSETVIAGFGEVALNFGDNLLVQVAGRFESYSKAGVSSLVPKVSVRWDVFNGFSLRGSFGQSFKAPQLAQISLDDNTSLSFIGAISTFKAVDTSTTTDGLDPESATNINLGLVYETGGLFLAFDYWTLSLDDPLLTESFEDVIAQVCPNRMCDNRHQLAYRLTMMGAPLDQASGPIALSGTNLNRVAVDLINGESLETGGYDLTLRYSFADWANPMELGFEWAHLDSYELSAALNGVSVVTEDHVGQLNQADSAVRPLPADKYRITWNMDIGALRLGAVMNTISAYTDENTDEVEMPDPNMPGETIEVDVGRGDVASQTTFNFNATYKLNSDKTRIFVQIDNLLDEPPPLARLDLSYDAYTHSPLGQTLKFGFLHQF